MPPRDAPPVQHGRSNLADSRLAISVK